MLILLEKKHGAIENLLQCYKNIKITQKNAYISLTYDELIKKNIKPAWYNSYIIEEVTENIKNTILSILTKNDIKNELGVLGYKEIRWFNNLYLLDEFLELFPNTKIILH